MRALLVVMLSLLIVSAQPATATSPLIPGMSVALEPTSASANLTQNQSLSLKFNGTVRVSQNRLSSMTVKLTGVVDTGWPVEVSPATLSFSGSGTQKFDCTVSVPGNATNGTASLVVTAKGNTRILLVTGTASATISLAMKNQTLPTNTTRGSGGGGAGGGVVKIAGLGPLALALVAAVVIAGAGGGSYIFIKKRKARRLVAWALYIFRSSRMQGK